MPNPVSPSPAASPAPANYNPRWFIWTIVFLVVAGVALVSYITFSDPAVEYQNELPAQAVVK